MATFRTDVELGHSYRDQATQFTGTAVSIHFYGDGICRVTLATLDKQGTIAEATFERHRLVTAQDAGMGFSLNAVSIPLVDAKAGGDHDHG